jgi:Brp/Blh family beta-carotene 15,15'-monooxygenase
LEFIIIFNFLILSGLFILKYVHHKDLFREYLNLLVLSILFYTTPLIISFGVYFGLWHSLGSTFDQIQFLKQKNSKFNIIDFSLKSIPLSIVSFIFFLIITLKLTNFSTQDLSSKTASFFIFLATITLPHTIMRDKLYQKIRC